MDFKALFVPIRLDRLPAHPARDVPAPLRVKARTRRVAELREAGQILAALPGPGETLHAIQSGRYDLADVVQVILDRRGQAKHLRIATLSYNARNVTAIASWLADGAVETFTMLCSAF